MKIAEIHKPIARRKLKTSLGQDIHIVIGCPEPFEDTDYFCPYSIEFNNSTMYGYAGGVDEIQSIQLCINKIGYLLKSLADDNCVELHWLDGKAGDIGIPTY